MWYYTNTYRSTVKADDDNTFWTFEGDFNGDNPNIQINLGATLISVILGNSSATHPFYIKTQLTSGNSDTVTGIVGNRASNGKITWTPETAGTYYYICDNHSNMNGTITVLQWKNIRVYIMLK